MKKSMKSSMKDRIKAAISRKQSESSTKFMINTSEVKWFEPQKISKVDIIPYVVEMEGHPDGIEPGEYYWYMPYKLHTSIGSDEKFYVCPKTFNKKCPICEYRSMLARDDYESNKEEIGKLKARDRMLIQVIDLDDRDAGIKLWDISYYLFGKKLETELLNSEDDSVFDFADLENGYTLKIRFIEEKLGTYSFLTADRIDFVPRTEQYDESILKEGYQLDKILREVSYDDLKKIAFEDAPYTIIFSEKEILKEENNVEKEEPEDDIPDEEIVNNNNGGEKEEPGAEPAEENSGEEDEEKKEPPRKRRRNKTEGNKCPFGHVFGKDGDKYPDCDECPDNVWEACVNGGE